MMTTTIAIQAGGRSSRMGRDKGLVPLAGKAMIEHVIASLSGLGDEIVITTNDLDRYAYLGQRLAADAEPGAGALSGLQTALAAAQGEVVFVTACDMPFPSRALIQHILNSMTGLDAVVPHVDGRLQPLHAAYRRATCLPAIQAALARGEKRAISFYDDIQVHTLDESAIRQIAHIETAFFNVNTPDELAQAEQMLSDK